MAIGFDRNAEYRQRKQGYSLFADGDCILSKYVWVQPLKDKKGPTVVKAFDQILKEGRQPLKLQTDKGKEFYNKDMAAWLKKNNIHHFSTGEMRKRPW